MLRVISFDKGSKRRLRQVRWRPFEKVSAAVLLLILSILCVLVALCDLSGYSHQSDEPRLEHQR